MGKKETKVKKTSNKEDKTIRVKTVVISIAVFIALVASFIGGFGVGFTTSTTVNESIERAVTAKYEQLKSES